MWLPKDERKLLRYYYRQINRIDTDQTFEIRDLIKALGKKEQSGPPKTKREIILDTYNTLENVNNLLTQRDLIKWKNLDPNSISAAHSYDHPTSQVLFENTKVNLCITLTIKGYDLGIKYDSRLGTAWVWCNEYKLWIILGVIISLIGVLVAIFKD
jgi:hypothetical protein